MHAYALALFNAVLATQLSAPTTTRMPVDLTRAIRDYDEAQVRCDSSELNRLLAPDYLLINSRGEVSGKREMLAACLTPGYSLDPFRVRDSFYRFWDGGAAVGGLVRLRGTSYGKRFDLTARFADIWVRRHGKWMVAFTELTPASSAGR